MAKKTASKPIKDTEVVKDIRDYLKAKSERDYILFLIGVTTGYRVGDLVRLKVSDIKEVIRREEFIICERKKFNSKNIKEKNRIPRAVPLLPSLKKILKEYIRDKKDYEYIFKSRKGINEHIGEQAVSNTLKEAGEYFGLDNISAHSMRKTYAYKIYKDSHNDIMVVKELLGHSSVEETKRYIGIDKELLYKYSQSLTEFV